MDWWDRTGWVWAFASKVHTCTLSCALPVLRYTPASDDAEQSVSGCVSPSFFSRVDIACRRCGPQHVFAHTLRRCGCPTHVCTCTEEVGAPGTCLNEH
eukprot:359537-Chlamydomonas_euryale.AAC.7